MSYKITVYFNDEDIATTRIFGANGFVDVTKAYGSSAYSATGFSGTTTFTATPASGCVFTQWVYRVGGTDAAQQTSTSNPFRYSGTEELIIRAEGKVSSSSTPSWTRYTGAFGTISSYDYVDISLGRYELYRYSVSFSESGTAYFYTEGTEVDVCGYLSTSSGWESENGEPSSYIKYDDDGHGAPNFGIQYNVTAGTTYYVWVRGLSGSSSGDVTLCIEPPAKSWSQNQKDYGTISAKKTESISISSYTLYRRKVVFSKSGTAKFYTTGTSTDTYGYLSTSTSWNSTTGRPTDYLASNDDGNGDGNFYISYNVTAGTAYYVWVRGYSDTTTGSTTLNIEPPVDTWTLVAGAFGTISSEASASFTLGTKQMRRYSVSFENSGSANFFAMGSEDTWGYLSTTTGFDSTNGMPTSYLAEDGTSGPGDNFAITYNVTAGTTYYIWVCESYGESTGTIQLYVQPPEKAVVRPSNFSWTYSKVKGGAFNLTAAEWNALTKRINEFRTYKQLSNYSFNTAYSGNNYMAYMYNQARLAIQGISGYGTYIPTVSSGDTITAAMMNVLVSELNAIP